MLSALTPPTGARLLLAIDVGERLPVGVAHDEARAVSSTDRGGGKRLDAVLLKVWTIELHASRLGKRLGEARWGAYPNEILLWRVPLESAEVRLRLGRALKDVRRDAALFQRFA